MCFKKQQIQDVVACLLINSYFTFGHNICQIIGTPIGSNPAPFLAKLYLYFYQSKWINGLKKNCLIKVKKLSNIFLVY